MKEIMHEYGSAIITVAIALLLFFMLFGTLTVEEDVGVVQILNAQTDLPQKDYIQYADAKETTLAMERELPMLIFRNEKISAGSSRRAEELFQGTDAEGNEAKLEILKAECPDGSKAEVTDNTIEFLQQGIYRIWVIATDTSCKVTQKVFEIPVVCR